jgi:hypothetical protein
VVVREITPNASAIFEHLSDLIRLCAFPILTALKIQRMWKGLADYSALGMSENSVAPTTTDFFKEKLPSQYQSFLK